MEDYQAAFLQRHQDTEVLHSSVRKVGAMHFGGCTIECLLKSMILDSLHKNSRREWKTDSNDPGHTITNPGHSFQSALKSHNRLRSRIEKFPVVKKWLDTVEHPSQHFIDMRYSDDDPQDESYKEWWNAYQRLRRWLLQQRTQL
jgi:hypothetical protein